VDLGLGGKVAIVTGAGSQSGFGRGIALRLATEGCDILVSDIDLTATPEDAFRYDSDPAESWNATTPATIAWVLPCRVRLEAA
jgi:NAD(P)-dependent dehydrogenase (short-subunit alcohol dehydrogenase family)